jgi:hypothetical protein
MQWWVERHEGMGPVDPYKLLGGTGSSSQKSNIVAHGGDAIAAYSALQRADLDADSRAEMEQSLLRYCELDTLAMVMIVQGLRGFLNDEN